MTEFLLYGLIAVLGAASGYFAGRWHGAAALAALKKQLEHDTQKFMGMLEERNESYVKYKSTYSDQSKEVRRLELELDQSVQRLAMQQEQEASLKQQLADVEPRIEKFRALAEQWNQERLGLREERATMQTELDVAKREQVQMVADLKSLHERLEGALKDKASLQSQLASRERETREFQRQAQKLEDSQETTDLSLAQMRVAKEELATRLAFAEGQLEALKGKSSSPA